MEVQTRIREMAILGDLKTKYARFVVERVFIQRRILYLEVGDIP
jgi:hypothetical protein